MPLVTCPDCKSEVSDQAAACPKCARPIAAATAPAGGVPIARVGPSRKSAMRVGAVSVFMIGVAVLIVGASGRLDAPAPRRTGAGGAIFGAGVIDEHGAAIQDSPALEFLREAWPLFALAGIGIGAVLWQVGKPRVVPGE